MVAKGIELEAAKSMKGNSQMISIMVMEFIIGKKVGNMQDIIKMVQEVVKALSFMLTEVKSIKGNFQMISVMIMELIIGKKVGNMQDSIKMV